MQANALSAADILEGRPRRVHEVIGPHLAERPQHPAFVERSWVWSYREFADAVDALVAELVELQVRSGDPVLIASACGSSTRLRAA
jgi:hypothetical protein